MSSTRAKYRLTQQHLSFRDAGGARVETPETPA